MRVTPPTADINSSAVNSTCPGSTPGAVTMPALWTRVNSADPGYTATDLNGHNGTQTIPEGAAEAIRLALLDPSGPTGGFSDSASVVPW